MFTMQSPFAGLGRVERNSKRVFLENLGIVIGH